MTINDVINNLQKSKSPVARVLYKTTHAKALVIGFKKDMELKEHKTATGGKLTVLEGSVIYRQEGIEKELGKFSEVDIPENIMHTVIAKEDSLCLLLL